MTGRPTNAASRSGIKSHVTKWMNVIKDYENVTVNLTIRNIILGAEQNLRSNYNKFAKLSSNVSKDLESANATQEEFDREHELQNKMEEDLNATLATTRRRKASERRLATLLGLTEKAAETEEISQRVHLSQAHVCPKTWQLKKRHDELNNLKKDKLIDKIIKLEDDLVEEIKIKENCLVSFNIVMHKLSLHNILALTLHSRFRSLDAYTDVIATPKPKNATTKMRKNSRQNFKRRWMYNMSL
jgi:hypothetical protein